MNDIPLHELDFNEVTLCEIDNKHFEKGGYFCYMLREKNLIKEDEDGFDFMMNNTPEFNWMLKASEFIEKLKDL